MFWALCLISARVDSAVSAPPCWNLIVACWKDLLQISLQDEVLVLAPSSPPMSHSACSRWRSSVDVLMIEVESTPDQLLTEETMLEVEPRCCQ